MKEKWNGSVLVMGVQVSKSAELYSPVQWLDCVRIHKFCLAKLVYSNTKALHSLNFSHSPLVQNIPQGWWREVSLEILHDRKRLFAFEKRPIPKEPSSILTEFPNVRLACGSIPFPYMADKSG